MKLYGTITTDDLKGLHDVYACTVETRSLCQGLSDVMAWNWIVPYLRGLGFSLRSMDYRVSDDDEVDA